MRAHVWRSDGRRSWGPPIPDELMAIRRGVAGKLLEAVAEVENQLLEKYLRGAGDHPRGDPQSAVRKATIDVRLSSRALWERLQEQGRAAAARRRDRLPADPGGPAAVQGFQGRGRGRRRWSASGRQRALRRPGLQDHERPPRRQAHLLRVYSGHAAKGGSRVLNVSTDKKERIGRILRMHANHREDMDVCSPVTSSPRWGSSSRPPATRSDRPRTWSSWSR